MNDHEKPAVTSDNETSDDFAEPDGFNVPFETFNWQRWLDMQAQTIQCFTRFQRAIERKQPKLALLIVLEMQDILMEWQKETYHLANALIE